MVVRSRASTSSAQGGRDTGVNRAVSILPDLAEQPGAVSAEARFLALESEWERLQIELRHRQIRQQAQRLTIRLKRLEAMLEMRHSLRGAEIKAKPYLLKRFIVWVKLERERGKVAYTFPLRDADLYTVPPGEFEQQDR